MFLWSDCVPVDDPLGWLQLSAHPCVSFCRLFVPGNAASTMQSKNGTGFLYGFLLTCKLGLKPTGKMPNSECLGGPGSLAPLPRCVGI